MANNAATFTVVRLNAAGAADPTFGGTGVVNVPLGAGTAVGIGATAVRGGPRNTTLVAGTDLSAAGSPRGTVIRLALNGALDTRFGSHGFARVSRAGREIRITGMVRDSAGRILLTGTAGAPDSIVVRLRANGARDKKFASGGLTYPTFGLPPGGNPIYTRIDAIDAAGGKAVLVGSAAGPGELVRSLTGTTYTAASRSLFHDFSRGALVATPTHSGWPGPPLPVCGQSPTYHQYASDDRSRAATTRATPGYAPRSRTSAPTRWCSQGTCGSCSGFIRTERRTRTPSMSISTFGCAAWKAGPSMRSVLR